MTKICALIIFDIMYNTLVYYIVNINIIIVTICLKLFSHTCFKLHTLLLFNPIVLLIFAAFPDRRVLLVIII